MTVSTTRAEGRGWRRPRVPVRTANVVGLILVLLVIAWLAVNAYQDWTTFVQLSLTGLTRGSLYALVALGYTLVYGILELINFAHADVFMIGGMIAATFALGVFDLGVNPGFGSSCSRSWWRWSSRWSGAACSMHPSSALRIDRCGGRRGWCR